MGTVNQDWLNGNEGRNYPLHPLATRASVDGEICPNDVLTDAQIWLPLSAGQVVYVSSAGLTSGLVTLTFLAAPFSPFCGSPPPPGSFVPLAVVRVSKPATRFKNYALEPLYPGAGGWVSFGGAVERSDISMRFAGPEATQLIDRCVHAYNDIPVLSLGKSGVARKLTGLVRLKGAPGASRTFKARRVIDGVERDVAVIALELGDDPVARLTDFAGTCGHRPAVGTCNKPPITEINGVKPDCDGNIELCFQGSQAAGDVQKGMLIDHPVELSQVCPPSFGQAVEPPDAADPIISSSSSSGSSESPSPPDPAYYCEYFFGIPAELTVRQGAFALEPGTPEVTQRWVSSPSILGPQFALDLLRSRDASTLYRVEAVVRPRTLLTGEGHVIYGRQSDNDFHFAGVTLRPSASYPNGRFFIGRKVAVGGAWPNGLGYGYLFDISYAPPAPLVNTDYRIIVEVSQAGPNFLTHLVVYWNDGVDRVLDQTFLHPPGFNQLGFAGLGVVDSESAFDMFGIDCPGFSSSSSSSSSSSP